MPFFGDLNMGKIKKPESELQKEKALREMVAATKAHYEVIEHIVKCKKFKKEYYCADCMGGSLITFTAKVLDELKYFDKCIKNSI